MLKPMPSLEERAGALHASLKDFMERAEARGRLAEIGDRILVASGLFAIHKPYPTVLRPRLVAVTGGPLSRHNPFLVGTFEHDSLEAAIIDTSDVRPTEAFEASRRPGPPEHLSEIALFGLRRNVVDSRQVELCQTEAEIYFGRISDQVLNGRPWWQH